jgi:hypothetical protein
MRDAVGSAFRRPYTEEEVRAKIAKHEEVQDEQSEKLGAVRRGDQSAPDADLQAGELVGVSVDDTMATPSRIRSQKKLRAGQPHTQPPASDSRARDDRGDASRAGVDAARRQQLVGHKGNS